MVCFECDDNNIITARVHVVCVQVTVKELRSKCYKCPDEHSALSRAGIMLLSSDFRNNLRNDVQKM